MTSTGPDYFGFVDRQRRSSACISLGWKGNVGAGKRLLRSALLRRKCGRTHRWHGAVAFRDADVESVAELGDPGVGRCRPAQRPTAPNWWPGSVGRRCRCAPHRPRASTPSAFWLIGLVLLLSGRRHRVVADRMVRALDRQHQATNTVRCATGSCAQFEIPLLGAALAAVLALSFSRMFLWATGNVAVLIAGIASVVDLGRCSAGRLSAAARAAHDGRNRGRACHRHDHTGHCDSSHRPSGRTSRR